MAFCNVFDCMFEGDVVFQQFFFFNQNAEEKLGQVREEERKLTTAIATSREGKLTYI